MIIVKLIGGLGNQMFQYAAARRLAHVHNVSLRMDLTGFNTYKLRSYDLGFFNITGTEASPVEIRLLKGNGAVSRYLEKMKPYCLRKVISERFFHFDPKVLKAPADVYMQGSWQSEKYFEDINDIIREEFTLKNALDAGDNNLAGAIYGTQSVALHIRRGDYVMNPVASRILGVCPLEYYEKAVRIIVDRIKDPVFYVFSDDAQWCRENLKLDYPMTFIERNGEDGHIDLWLMSCCKHNIIANSSFSWWGAWLNKSPGKIIVAPKRWFNSRENDPKDLIPKGWLSI